MKHPTNREHPAAPGDGNAGTINVLLVQSEAQDCGLKGHLQDQGFAVTCQNSVKSALTSITQQNFSALICELHLPTAGDGFTLVNSMVHFHPKAVTMILSDYPQLRESFSAMLPQADEVLVTPLPDQEIVKLLKMRLKAPKVRPLASRDSVASILERYSKRTIAEWLKKVNASQKVSVVSMSTTARMGHLPVLFDELVNRLRTPRVDEGIAKISPAALAHGTARRNQGYTSAMLVEESRILQVCIFKTLRNNLNAVDLALVLTDVMTIADEVDSQLSQTMSCFADNGGRKELLPPNGSRKPRAPEPPPRTRKEDRASQD